MAIRNSLILFLALIITASLSKAVMAQVEDAPAVIQAFVDGKGKKAEVPAEINKLVYGDVNGDKVKDAVIQYNVQIGYPGNNFLSYIAVFVKKNGKYVFTAQMENGAKLASVLVPSSVKNKVIVFDKYAPQGFDKIGTAKFKVTGKKLVKVK